MTIELKSADTSREEAMRAGARNLLLGCAGVETGDHVLLVREDARHGYYHDDAADFVADEATALGARVHSLRTPRIDGPEHFPSLIAGAMEGADHTIFFSRIGDQLRFDALPGPGTKTMTYAVDGGYLGSGFCTVPHGLMVELLDLFHAALDGFREWRVTSANGTDASGQCAASPVKQSRATEFTLRLFPVMIFRPISCASMTGRVVLDRWIASTNTHIHDPHAVILSGPVAMVVEGGRIAAFEGARSAVGEARGFYDRGSSKLGLDADVIHSWHTGINPQTFYPYPPEENLTKWANMVFGSPRYTHFHTCGDYAPGEISWPLIDATVSFDGEDYWRDGRFLFLDRPEVRALLDKYPGAARAFEMRTDIGV